MNAGDLKRYLREQKVPNDMPIIIDGSPVYSIGTVVASPLKDQIGEYLELTTAVRRMTQRQKEIQRLENFIRRCRQRGMTREEAKDYFMEVKVKPFIQKDHIFFQGITKESFFSYESMFKPEELA